MSGVVYVPTAASDEQNRRIVEKFIRKDIPVVLTDRTIPGLELDYVTTDNLDGSYKISRHLIEQGHRQIGMVFSSLSSTERLRYEGYKKALTDYHIPIDPSIIIIDNGPFIPNRYFQYARKLLKQKDKMTAIFEGHDRIALQFYSAAKEMGIAIPEDILVTG